MMAMIWFCREVFVIAVTSVGHRTDKIIDK